jgi:hypothetical protein
MHWCASSDETELSGPILTSTFHSELYTREVWKEFPHCTALFRKMFHLAALRKLSHFVSVFICYLSSSTEGVWEQAARENIWTWKGWCGEHGMAQSVSRRTIGWRAGVHFPAGTRDFCIFHSDQNGSGAYTVGTGCSFLQRPECEAQHLHSSSASTIVELFSTTPYASVAWCLIN